MYQDIYIYTCNAIKKRAMKIQSKNCCKNVSKPVSIIYSIGNDKTGVNEVGSLNDKTIKVGCSYQD